MRWSLLLFLPFLTLSTLATGKPARNPGSASPAADIQASDPTSPAEVFAQMKDSFRPDRARGQHLKFQFNFTDPQGGKWWLQVDDGSYTMGQGTIPRPDVTFACTGADWVRLSVGTLGGFKAFLTGRLRVSGSQFTAHKLDEIFP